MCFIITAVMTVYLEDSLYDMFAFSDNVTATQKVQSENAISNPLSENSISIHTEHTELAQYNAANTAVTLLSGSKPIKAVKAQYADEYTEQSPVFPLTDAEKHMLAVTAWNADFTSNESLLCVLQTIYNRVYNSDKFPDTVEAVLSQPHQFENCDKVLYDVQDYNYDRVAALIDAVWNGDVNVFDGANVLFYSADYVPKYKVAKNLTLILHSGGTNFYEQD